MKRLLLIILCCLLLTACSQSVPEPTEVPQVSVTIPKETLPPETDAPTEAPTGPETEPPTEVPAEAPTEPEIQKTTVTIYYANENYDGFQTSEVAVNEVNMNVLVEKLITVGVLTEDVGIWAMQQDGTCLRLSFSPSFGDLICSQGTTGEYIIMGSVVNTFLDAYPDFETVFITVGNEILESGHVVYDFEMGRFN